MKVTNQENTPIQIFNLHIIIKHANITKNLSFEKSPIGCIHRTFLPTIGLFFHFSQQKTTLKVGL
jgi:hypothetical protein